MSDNNRIFDEYPTIDCNDCNHYWNNSCDGVKKGSERLCNAFIATRNVIIPEEIKSLKKALSELGIAVVFLCGVVLLLLLKVITTIV